MSAIDIVIVSYNSRSDLRDCVEPIARSRDARVIVVDNASGDRSLEAVADLPVTAIPLPSNRGFASGCNVGWRAGEAPFVLFLNPDARIDVASIDLLRGVLERKPSIGLVAPKIIHDDGSIQFSQHRFPRPRTTFARALFLHRLVPSAGWASEDIRDPAAYEHPGSPDWVGGACILLRRSTLEQLGGFDERFFLYCEDTDLCFRLRDAGLDIRYEPKASAVHAGGASAPRADLLPVLASSRKRYAEKHRSPLAAFLERIGLALGAVTHAVISCGGFRVRTGHLRSLRLILSRG